MEILIDRLTNNVVGLNMPSTPLNIVVEAEDNLSLAKTIYEVSGEKQKTNDQGQLLYKINIVPVTLETGETIETYDETTEPNGTPVMEQRIEAKVVSLQERPNAFTLDEVLTAKYRFILEASSYDYILADMFLDENDLDLADSNANTGFGILQLLPNGQAITKEIILETSSNIFNLLEFDADPGVDIYINDIRFIDNKVISSTPLNSCIIKFVNTMDKPKMVRSYAVAY